MKKIKIILLSLFILIIIFPFNEMMNSWAQVNTKDYLNPNLPIEKRVNDLLNQMTLEEKVGQMVLYNPRVPNSVKLAAKGLVGGFVGVRESAEVMDKLQKAAVNETRLGIPLIFGFDVIHGYSTIFPIPLAEASTWNPDIVKQAAIIAAEEASSQGLRWTMSPMVDIARDPRWGRIAEGAGEDPYLQMAMAKALVKGYQGEKLNPNTRLVTCVKHFAGYGAAEGGRDYNTAEISERTLREIYLPPFKAAVDAGAGTFMTAFDDLDGIPATANSFLNKKILRGEWSFKGILRGDFGAIGELVNHGIACDSTEAALKAAKVGVDMDMMGPYHDKLVDLVKEGKLPIKVINQAVRRILTLKFEIGLFEKPFTDLDKANNGLMHSEYLETARQISKQSIVLLKNDHDLLPLEKNIKSIAVIGPLADDRKDLLGCWHAAGDPGKAVSLLSGIKSKVSRSVKIIYAKGCEINDSTTGGFPEAIEAAKKADVVILAVGESSNMSGEAKSRSSLDLPGVQQKLVKKIMAIGTPVVEVLMNGRPLSISWSAKHVPAILETWFLGTEAGNAVADVIFGDYNPSGKLPATFPRTVGQVPIYYNHKNTGRPASEQHFSSKYLDLPITPLYPFGYGLSYTKFKFTNLTITIDSSGEDQFIVGVDVTNSGKMKGAEVAQLYYRQKCASITRPVKQLAGFKRVNLEPGETKTVKFILTPYQLSFYNQNMERVVESGNIEVMVGGNSEDVISKNIYLPKSIKVSEQTPDFN